MIQGQNGPRSVLIVDDNADDVLLMQLALAKNGVEVNMESTASGKQGLKHILEGDRLPDLVLLDISMPGMDGFEVLRQLKSNERSRAIPVIIVTHSGLISDVMSSLKTGAIAFLQKTSDFEKFAVDVKTVLDRVTKEQ